MKKQTLGTHIISEVTNCNPDLLNDEKFLRKLFIKACKFGGAGVISVQSHKFNPQGVTVLVMLAESHFSCHAWPEYSYAAIDCFTCGKKVKPKKILEYIRERLSGSYKTKAIRRGLPKNDL